MACKPEGFRMNEKGFRGIIGHKEAVSALQNSIKSGRIPHAWLFAGEDGVGKHFLAKTFAAALLCREGGEEPCMRCPSCRRILSGNEPDLKELVREKPDLITVKEVREQIVANVGIRPFASRYKVCIVDDAEKMNPQAQNALLKTIEEPPPYAILLLLSNVPEALLPTILSRCVRMDIRTVSKEAVEGFLTGELRVPKKEAKALAVLAQGNLGRAKELSEGGSLRKTMETVPDLARRVREMPLSSLSAKTESLLKEGAGPQDILDTLLLWFRDVLVYKATGDMERVVFRRTPEEMGELRAESALLPYDALEDIFAAIQKAGARIRANVGAPLSLELAFAAIAGAYA